MSPLELGLVEQPTRPRSTYTAKIRREAIDACDAGKMGPAADLTRAAMTESGYARGVLGSLVYGLWGLPLNFVGDPTMVAALCDSAERQGAFRQMFPQPDAIRLMSWGVTLGVAPGQMRRVWRDPGQPEPVSVEDAESGAWCDVKPTRPVGAPDLRVLRCWDPKWLRHQWWDDSWWLMTADGEIRLTPNDGEWILYTPYGSQKAWEYGAWKALTLAFVLGRDALFDRARHAEVLAPVRVGNVPQGTTEKQRLKYLRQIREMQRMASFVLPPGLDYKIVESTHKIGDIYDQIVKWTEREVALIFTGNETTTTGAKGFSNGDVQERIARSTLSSFASSLAACLHDGGLVHWARDNYGTIEAPRAEIDCSPPADKKLQAETVDAAGKALVSMATGLEKVGLRVTTASAQTFAQRYGFEVEQVPAGEARAAKIDLAPTDKAKWFRGREIRGGEGYAPFGDERDDMTGPELDAYVLAKHAPTPTEPGPSPTDPIEPLDIGAEQDAAPTDESAANLAAKMTEHAIPKCEHGSSNRCRKCGVERLRDFELGTDGPAWKVAWRPIVGTAATSRRTLRARSDVATLAASRAVSGRATVAAGRAIETDADGKAPSAARLWRAGVNETDKGALVFSVRSADLVMKAYAKRGNPLKGDYEHETLLPLDKRGGAPMRGVSSGEAVLEVRPDANGKPELWASNIAWTNEAKRQIEARERNQISPVQDFDRETREILEIKSFALCFEGATHIGTLLTSATNKEPNMGMEELQAALQEAIANGDTEKAEALVAQMETLEEGDSKPMSKAARGYASAAKSCMAKMSAKAVAKPADAPPAAEKPAAAMAASRTTTSVDTSAMTRVIEEAQAATKRSDRATVRMMIATSRGCFDAADEREHLDAANPEATERHIASVSRKLAAGTLAASRTTTEAKPPKDAPQGAENHGLTELEMGIASQTGVSFADFAKSKSTIAAGAKARRGGK